MLFEPLRTLPLRLLFSGSVALLPLATWADTTAKVAPDIDLKEVAPVPQPEAKAPATADQE
ncbi:MAG: succinylglutamate desuccinylase, partial [Marinobacter sp.]|nr:succinylglutamate desuccinylase [Marinobacter sp.]